MLSYGGERRRGDLPLEQTGERYAQLIALAAVAQVELAREAARARVHALGLELVARFSFQLLENLLGMRGADLGKRAELRTHVVVHHIGTEEAKRRECAGLRWNQNTPHPQLGCDRRSVHAAGSAERQQRERRKVHAPLGRKDADCIGHAHVYDALDADSRRQDIHAQGIGDVPLESSM